MVSKRLGKSAVKKTETAYKLSYRLYGEKGEKNDRQDERNAETFRGDRSY